ncbi:MULTISPECIES: FG-GAP-like repeat-containing protein [unclassified Bradyrhizobium]|uniref:FG-GAP-like repeat-containing protein n=1 Tax=unclassified Bradyrhizobium TaxID=2631580 RepID=UPI002915FE78|nr:MULTISPECIES: FG-GAP-like repeat-containing protein [unclassified Bradyrhizobium]
MSLPGSFSVNQGGAAAYSIPIAVPPGTAGVVPSLSLDYSSSGANGIMGVGWSLGGLPSVGRCPRTMVQDGVIGTVNFDGSDRFCLDGQRLILVSGSYGGDGAEYRTEIDVYSKVISHGAAGNGPAWFEVRTKAGQIMEFGHTADSQVPVVGRATARAWGVNKVSDTKGNYFSVTYVTNASTGQSVPSWIVYTGNASAGVAPYNSVAFVYAQRSDVIQHYHAGSLVQTSDRLTNIKTFAGATLVADYRLTYQQSPTSGVSEVTSIAACGGDGSCLPASTFQWASGGGDSFSAAVMAVPNGANFGSPSSTTSGVGRGHVLQGAIGFTPIYSDFDGDGTTDFLMLYGPNLFAFLSKGDGTYTFVNSSAPNSWNFGNDPFSSYALISGDFNGDGKSEFAMLSGGVLYTFLSNGDGTFRGVATPCPNGWNFGTPPQATYTTIAGDFNSDGRSDFLLMSGQFMYEFLSNGDGTFSGNTINIGPTNFGNRPSDNYTPISGDFNGDGKADFIMMGGAYLYEFFGNGDGTFAYSALQISNGWNFGNPPDNSFVPISGDFNGDGKTDWVMLQGTYLYEFQSKGDGTFNYITIPIPSSVGWNFGTQPAASFSPLSGDFNADGKSDFAFIGGNSPYIYQFLSNGDATFSYHLLPMPNNWNFGAPVTASYWLFGGDFKGDGKAGFTLLDATHVYSVMVNGGAGDYIVGFTTGLGVTTAVTYKPITSSAVYTKDTTATYPYVDLQSASFVVSRVDASNGVGGTYSSTYAYAGAKADITGRGMLGFRQMTVNDLQTGISDVTTFRQDFPYIGMVASTTRTLGSQTLGQSTNTYQFTNAAGTTTISPSSAPYRVSLAQNVASGSDLDGSVLPTVTTANQYDAYGNATRVTVSTPDGYSKTTVNTYSNDPSLWYLGRLTRASVTSVAP